MNVSSVITTSAAAVYAEAAGPTASTPVRLSWARRRRSTGVKSASAERTTYSSM